MADLSRLTRELQRFKGVYAILHYRSKNGGNQGERALLIHHVKMVSSLDESIPADSARIARATLVLTAPCSATELRVNKVCPR